MEETTQEIEINGVKFDIDMRHAKRIDTFKIGTKVKLLIKTDSSYGSDSVKTGVVVGFEPFETMPTVTICYLDIDYSSASLKFAYVNNKSREKYELVACIDDDLPVQKQDVLSKLDNELERKRSEITDLEQKRSYFLSHFNQWFEPETT